MSDSPQQPINHGPGHPEQRCNPVHPCIALPVLLAVAVALVLGPVGAGPVAADDADDPTAMAEPPLWPKGWQLPPPLGPEDRNPDHDNADILIWTPPEADRIRAVLLVPNNTDSIHWSEHDPVREAAKKHEMGIVYMRRYHTGIEWDIDEPDRSRMLDLLADVAERTGVAEFEHAPWITFGKSSRGSFPFRMGWIFPERTIASISYHAETPTWPIAEWGGGEDHSILHVNAMGETEWGGTWFVHVRPSLLNYHLNTDWLGHIMVAKDVGHGDYGDEGGRASPLKLSRDETWDYLAVFTDKALELRLPDEGYPTDGPIELKQVDRDSGYLIEPFAVETLFEVPRNPLREDDDGGYKVGGDGDVPVSGYASFSPPEDFTVPDGVPVVQPDTEREGFDDWLVTEQHAWTMKTDPMTEPDKFKSLRPEPGDEIEIDDETFTFGRIDSGRVADEGGIRVQPQRMTMLAYTVLEVSERKHYKLVAPHTPATRQQVILNGEPVKHEQVIELEPGRYPLLLVVRMSVRWGRIGPWLTDVSDEHIALAKQIQAEADEAAAEMAQREAERGDDPPVVIHKASTVPEPDRRRMFWVADREQAEAWFEVHNVHDQPLKISE